MSGSIFVGGFVLGGLIVGALGCIYAPQVCLQNQLFPFLTLLISFDVSFTAGVSLSI